MPVDKPASISHLKQIVAERRVFLSEQEKKVLRTALANPQAVAWGTTQELAAISGASASTVTRTAQALGFGSFRDFRALFRNQIRTGTSPRS